MPRKQILSGLQAAKPCGILWALRALQPSSPTILRRTRMPVMLRLTLKASANASQGKGRTEAAKTLWHCRTFQPSSPMIFWKSSMVVMARLVFKASATASNTGAQVGKTSRHHVALQPSSSIVGRRRVVMLLCVFTSDASSCRGEML